MELVVRLYFMIGVIWVLFGEVGWLFFVFSMVGIDGLQILVFRMFIFVFFVVRVSVRFMVVEDLLMLFLLELMVIMFFMLLILGWFFICLRVVMLWVSFQLMVFVLVMCSSLVLYCFFSVLKVLFQMNGICSLIWMVLFSQVIWCSVLRVVRLCFRVGCWKLVSVLVIIVCRCLGDLVWDCEFILIFLLF